MGKGIVFFSKSGRDVPVRFLYWRGNGGGDRHLQRFGRMRKGSRKGSQRDEGRKSLTDAI